MAKHTLKILQQLFQGFQCVFDHFVDTIDVKRLRIFSNNFGTNILSQNSLFLRKNVKKFSEKV